MAHHLLEIVKLAIGIFFLMRDIFFLLQILSAIFRADACPTNNARRLHNTNRNYGVSTCHITAPQLPSE
jgi:hypothetical protein